MAFAGWASHGNAYAAWAKSLARDIHAETNSVDDFPTLPARTRQARSVAPAFVGG